MIVEEIYALFGVKTDSSWGDLQKRLTGVNRSFLRLRNLFVGAGIFGALRSVANASDTFQNLHSRLRLVASSQEEVNSLFEKARTVAKDARSDLSSTVNGFSRIAQSVRGMGLNISNEDLLNRVGMISKASRLGGSNPTESKQGFIQLTQAIGENKLHGQELRSVLQELPGVADQIAKHLGVTRGQLRQMAEDGKLTAKVILDSFGPDAADEINKSFAEITPTVGDAWTNFKNEMMVTLGELAKDTDFVAAAKFAFEGLAVALHLVAGAARVVGKAIKWLVEGVMNGDAGPTALAIGLGVAIASVLVPALISLAGAAALAFEALLTGSTIPMVAVITAIAYGVIQLIKHWDDVKKALGDAAEWALEKWDAFLDWLGDAWEDFWLWAGDLPIIKQIRELVDDLRGLTDDPSLKGETYSTKNETALEDAASGKALPYQAEIDAAYASVYGTPTANAPPGAGGGPGGRVNNTTLNLTINGVKDAPQAVDEFDKTLRHTMDDVGGD